MKHNYGKLIKGIYIFKKQKRKSIDKPHLREEYGFKKREHPRSKKVKFKQQRMTECKKPHKHYRNVGKLVVWKYIYRQNSSPGR